jgi:beta-glucosidase
MVDTGGMSFPDGFWLGTMASSVGAEGAAPTSDWSGWEEAGRAPRSADGNGFVTRAADDLALLASHGIRRHRLTLEWARLEPTRGEHDVREVTRYLDVLRTARRLGVEVWVCLHHLSLPGWFSEDERGFLDERMARRVWPGHVDWIAETFGDLVSGWIPMHEPVTYAALAYGEGIVPPGRRDEDDHMTVERAIRAANREAARLLHDGNAPVVCAHGAGVDPEELKLDAEVFDAIGLDHVAVDDGSLLVALRRLAEDIGADIPLAITACGVGTSDEDERAGKLTASLAQVQEAISEGLDVRGFFYRTAIDGYEWHDGFNVSWGLFDRDRNPRPALDVLRDET